MRRFLLVLSIFAVAIMPGFALSQSEQEAGFVPLFDGNDLAGWKIIGNEKAWEVVDGTIHAAPNLDGGYICSESEYENFIFRMQFKMGNNANSGVFIHAPKHGRESQVGGEIQLFDSNGQEPTIHNCGAIYDVLPPTTMAVNPAGEWNDIEIEYNDPHLKVTINNTVVQDLNVNDYDRLRWRRRHGPFGLQEHGHHVWFRDVRVKDLGGNEYQKWTPLFNQVDLRNWSILGDSEWKAKPQSMILKIKDTSKHPNQWKTKFSGWDFDLFRELGKAKVKFKDAAIVSGNDLGMLISDATFKDFQLWAYVKGNYFTSGGIAVRWKSKDDPGYKIRIGYRPEEKTYVYGSIDGLVPASGVYAGPEEWYPLQIIAKGKEVQVVSNGRPVANYDNADDREGHIVLYIDKKGPPLQLKDIRIQELK